MHPFNVGVGVAPRVGGHGHDIHSGHGICGNINLEREYERGSGKTTGTGSLLCSLVEQLVAFR